MLEWLAENQTLVFGIGGALVVVLGLISKATKNPYDDVAHGLLDKALTFLKSLVGKKPVAPPAPLTTDKEVEEDAPFRTLDGK